MKASTGGILLLLAMGVAKLPLEEKLTQSLRSQGLQTAPPEVSWQENFGQMFLATLGGLRNLVASITYLEAYSAWSDLDWGRVDNLMTLTTRLQPTEPSYWDEASWQMAYNAASHFRNQKDLRYAIKHKLFRDHVQRGIDILEEGLRFLPDNPKLLMRLGDIFVHREPDPRRSSECYLKAFQNGAPANYERYAAYEMVKLSDRASWEMAYEILKRYWDRGAPFTKMASIQRDLPVLEERLNIPAARRIRVTAPVPPPRGVPRAAP